MLGWTDLRDKNAMGTLQEPGCACECGHLEPEKTVSPSKALRNLSFGILPFAGLLFGVESV